MSLTPRQKEVLRALYHMRNRAVLWGGMATDLTGWVRPMDLGGSDCSYHSRALKQLVVKGLVEKSNRGGLPGTRSYRYKITKNGITIAEGGKVEE